MTCSLSPGKIPFPGRGGEGCRQETWGLWEGQVMGTELCLRGTQGGFSGCGVRGTLQQGWREHAELGWFHHKREPHAFGKPSGKLEGARITAPGKSG